MTGGPTSPELEKKCEIIAACSVRRRTYIEAVV